MGAGSGGIDTNNSRSLRQTTTTPRETSSRKYLGLIVTVTCIVIIATCVYFSLRTHPSTPNHSTLPKADPTLIPPPSESVLGVFSKAAVVSHGAPCPAIGRDMLSRGGSAVDAIIATLLCDGVCVIQSMGVGGGFLMTFYNKTEHKAYSLVARETAPGAADASMFVKRPQFLTFGPLSAGIPGELKGYQEAHRRFGRLPWRDLFQPTIKLCEEGVPVSKRMVDNMDTAKNLIQDSPTFKESILKSTGGRYPKEGEFIKLPVLAQTLRVIADSPIKADELYKGSLTKTFVEDIQNGGGIISEKDMNNYNVRWEEPYTANLSGGLTVFSASLPGSGILVNFMLRLLDGSLKLATTDLQRSQLMVETFKHAYGRRTNLGDPQFVNQTLLNQVVKDLTNEAAILDAQRKIKLDWTSNDISFYGADYMTGEHGTNNVVAVDKEGNAVCVTSSINLHYGSKFVSRGTGILLNNVMDDFGTPGKVNYFGFPPSDANLIAPGKRPLSSMSPTVIVDKDGNVRLVLGAAGGSTIATQVTAVAVNNLWLGKNIKQAIDTPRFHHQLVPMRIMHEDGINKDLVDGWQAIGHKMMRTDILAVVTGIARQGDSLTANCDWRKPGAVAGL